MSKREPTIGDLFHARKGKQSSGPPLPKGKKDSEARGPSVSQAIAKRSVSGQKTKGGG